MFGSIRIATIRGIPIHLHITLLAMVALLMLRFGFVLGIPAGVILFGSVLLHELGHALVAQRYGIRIASIVLHLLGGMALMTRPPERPRDEAIIAAAGPAVSFVLGSIFTVLAILTGVSITDLASGLPLRFAHLFAIAASLNIAMAFFNLLPALPMDGGRIFRAVLAERLGGARATRIAAWVSRAFGAAFIVFGVARGHWLLAVFGVLLFLMVSNEERIAEAREAMRREPPAEPPPPPGRVRETREELTDSFGRRYVVITRVIE